MAYTWAIIQVLCAVIYAQTMATGCHNESAVTGIHEYGEFQEEYGRCNCRKLVESRVDCLFLTAFEISRANNCSLKDAVKIPENFDYPCKSQLVDQQSVLSSHTVHEHKESSSMTKSISHKSYPVADGNTSSIPTHELAPCNIDERRWCRCVETTGNKMDCTLFLAWEQRQKYNCSFENVSSIHTRECTQSEQRFGKLVRMPDTNSSVAASVGHHAEDSSNVNMKLLVLFLILFIVLVQCLFFSVLLANLDRKISDIDVNRETSKRRRVVVESLV